MADWVVESFCSTGFPSRYNTLFVTVSVPYCCTYPVKALFLGIVLKAMVGNEIIGTVRAYSDKETCYIAKLVVDSNCQNKGIAQSLMQSIEADFKEVKRFELFTGFKSAKNLYLYEKLGYSEFKRETIRENVTLVFMEKRNDGT